MSQEDYLWCTRCNRTYLARDCRLENQRSMCAYEGCPGLRVLAVAWPALRKFNPTLPAAPSASVVYPFGVRLGEAAPHEARLL